MQDVTLRQLTELWFTFYPYLGTLQFFNAVAALLNSVAQALGWDVKFVGL